MPLPYEPIETDPVINVPYPAFSNPDLPAPASPTLERIIATNLVGTLHANKQPKALEKRTLSSIAAHQRVAEILAEIDNVYLRRDGTSQKTNGAGVLADMQMNNHQLLELPVSTANGHAVEHSQMVTEAAERVADVNALQASKADLANPAFTGVPTAPTAGLGTATTQIATTEFVQAALAAVSTLIIPNYDLEGAGVDISVGGVFYFSTLTVGSVQTLGVPVKVYCSGAMTVNAAINSSSPIEIECRGTLTINAAITAPFITIRCVGACNINAALSTHTGLVNFNKTYAKLSLESRPALDDLYWCPVLIESGTLTTTAGGTVTGDDVFINCTGDITLGSVIRASVLIRSIPGPGVLYDHTAYNWHDGYRIADLGNDFTNRGGNGGTGGGWARSGNSAQASIWRGTNKPLLLHTYDLARGGVGQYIDTAQRGAPGGRVSVYSGGNIAATGATISARGRNGNAGFVWGGSPGSSGQSAGGGGTCRGVAAGSITGGLWEAPGGNGNGSQENGAGGGVYLLANSYPSAPTLDATAISNGVNGTSSQVSAPTNTIRGLNGRGIFSVFPPLTPLRY